MKRRYFLALVAVSALALSGCSNGQSVKTINLDTEAESQTVAATEKPTEAPTETETETESELKLAENRLDAELQVYDSGTLTVMDGSGKQLVFDIHPASINLTKGFTAGNQIAIHYNGTINGTDTSGATVTAVTDAGAEPNAAAEEPSFNYIDGKVVSLTSNTLTLSIGGNSETQAATDAPAEGSTEAVTEAVTEAPAQPADDGSETLTFTIADTDLSCVNGIMMGNLVTLEYSGYTVGDDTDGVYVNAVYNYVENGAVAANGELQIITGTVAGVGLEGITVVSDADNNTYTFPVNQAALSAINGFHTGDSVNVAYYGTLNSEDMSGVAVDSIEEYELPTSASAWGTVIDATANTITIQTPDGAVMYFDITGVTLPEGFTIGMYVRVIEDYTNSTNSNLKKASAMEVLANDTATAGETAVTDEAAAEEVAEEVIEE